MAKQSALDRKIADLDAEIERLTAMRDFLTAPSAETAPKRERKPKRIKAAAPDKEGI